MILVMNIEPMVLVMKFENSQDNHVVLKGRMIIILQAMSTCPSIMHLGIICGNALVGHVEIG